MVLSKADLGLLRRAIELGRQAAKRGDHPFGAVLTDASGRIVLEAANSVVTGGDCTAHAETNLVQRACREFDEQSLASCSLYSSAEPCPMCAGAIYWAGIGRVVYALSQGRLYRGLAQRTEVSPFLLSVRDVLASGAKPIEVFGPAIELEAWEIHRAYWG